MTMLATNIFLDWRPVPLPPIQTPVFSGDARTISGDELKVFEFTDDYKNVFSLDQLVDSISYCSRADGFFIFNFDISNNIKSKIKPMVLKARHSECWAFHDVMGDVYEKHIFYTALYFKPKYQNGGDVSLWEKDVENVLTVAISRHVSNALKRTWGHSYLFHERLIGGISGCRHSRKSKKNANSSGVFEVSVFNGGMMQEPKRIGRMSICETLGESNVRKFSDIEELLEKLVEDQNITCLKEDGSDGLPISRPALIKRRIEYAGVVDEVVSAINNIYFSRAASKPALRMLNLFLAIFLAGVHLVLSASDQYKMEGFYIAGVAVFLFVIVLSRGLRGIVKKNGGIVRGKRGKVIYSTLLDKARCNPHSFIKYLYGFIVTGRSLQIYVLFINLLLSAHLVVDVFYDSSFERLRKWGVFGDDSARSAIGDTYSDAAVFIMSLAVIVIMSRQIYKYFRKDMMHVTDILYINMGFLNYCSAFSVSVYRLFSRQAEKQGVPIPQAVPASQDSLGVDFSNAVSILDVHLSRERHNNTMFMTFFTFFVTISALLFTVWAALLLKN